MADPVKAQTATAAAKPTAKKRTIYTPKGMLSLPEWAAKDKEHKYRWVSKRKMARSDGFDPRGWSIAKDPTEGKSLEAYDTVLYRMPLDEWEALKEYKDNLAKNSLQNVKENIDSQIDQLRFEIEKLGGKISHEFSVERKIS